jgi:hypothetical protein
VESTVNLTASRVRKNHSTVLTKGSTRNYGAACGFTHSAAANQSTVRPLFTSLRCSDVVSVRVRWYGLRPVVAGPAAACALSRITCALTACDGPIHIAAVASVAQDAAAQFIALSRTLFPPLYGLRAVPRGGVPALFVYYPEMRRDLRVVGASLAAFDSGHK